MRMPLTYAELLLTIAKGDKGDPGPQGPQGPAGERGPVTAVPASHTDTFDGCGRLTTIGAAELAQIPDDWK